MLEALPQFSRRKLEAIHEPFGENEQEETGSGVRMIGSGLGAGLERDETLVVEATATIGRLEQALARIDSYLTELRRTFQETNDPGVALTIEQRTRQRAELQNNLRAAQTQLRRAARRQEEIEAIFEREHGFEEDRLPPAFAHARATFFTDLLNPTRSNPFANNEWLRNPHARAELCEFLTNHVPHFVLVQETLVHAYQERYPTWDEQTCTAYARKMLPMYLKQLSHLVYSTGRMIEANDPKAPVAPIYEQAAQLLLHALDRIEETTPDGNVLWKSIADLSRPDDPVGMLLATHQRSGAPAETREVIVDLLSKLFDQAVTRGQESSLSAQSGRRRFRKFESIPPSSPLHS